MPIAISSHRLIVLTLLLACAPPVPSRLPDQPPLPFPAAPDSFQVRFETTQGAFYVNAHREWSPLGVDRLYELVERRTWDDIVIFRVVRGFVVQFGITSDSTLNRAWRGRGVADEPVRESNRRGRVSFARGGPATRSMQIFVNTADNPRLDTLAAGAVTGYPPIAEVVLGMDVVDAFFAEHGNQPSRFQDSIATQGNAWLDRAFPGLDRVISARVVKVWHQ
jgi:cyclophilin family peptidyl-prolyl cis-trans isomerase